MSQSAAQLLQGATGIKFGPAGIDPHTYFQGQGSGPFGMPAHGLRGKTPLTDQDGKSLATLKLSTSNGDMGQLTAELVLPDGNIFARIERKNRNSAFTQRGEPMTITVNDAQYATVDSGASGSLQRADGSGGIEFQSPYCQPSLQWCLFAFICFFPTAGIASIYAVCCAAEQAGRTVNVSSVNSAPLDDAPLLHLVYSTIPAFHEVAIDFAQYSGLDERSKLDLVLLLACQVCQDHTERK